MYIKLEPHHGNLHSLVVYIACGTRIYLLWYPTTVGTPTVIYVPVCALSPGMFGSCGLVLTQHLGDRMTATVRFPRTPCALLVPPFRHSTNPSHPTRPPPTMTDDEVQSGAAVLAHESQPGTRVEGAACADPRVGGAHVRGQVEADLRSAGVPGELPKGCAVDAVRAANTRRLQRRFCTTWHAVWLMLSAFLMCATFVGSSLVWYRRASAL